MKTAMRRTATPDRPLTKAEFEYWLEHSKADIRVMPYTVKPCRCRDVNCKGWRLVAAVFALLVVFVAAPASAQSSLRDVTYRVSQGAALAAHGADGFSTEYAIARGAFHETNPLLLRVTTAPAWFGAFDMSAAAATLWLTSRIDNRAIATVANCALAGFFAGVAIHNTRVIARVERGLNR